MKPTESQFPISHVNKLHNIGDEHFKHEGDNEGKVKGGSYEVKGRGYNDKYEASARFELPGATTQQKWGATTTGTIGYSDPENAQDTFETPNAARQAAINNASTEHTQNIKSGEYVREPQVTRKGGTIKINSNPVKGK